MADKPKGPSKVAQIAALRIAQAEERERRAAEEKRQAKQLKRK